MPPKFERIPILRTADFLSQERGEAADQSGGKLFDPNCITPGTEFMETVDKCMTYFIQRKVLV